MRYYELVAEVVKRVMIPVGHEEPYLEHNERAANLMHAGTRMLTWLAAGNPVQVAMDSIRTEGVNEWDLFVQEYCDPRDRCRTIKNMVLICERATQIMRDLAISWTE